MNTNEIILEAKNVSKCLSDDVSIDNLNFSMRKGEKIAFIGETGSGKTSILKIIGGLMQPDSGMVIFKNEKVKGPDETLIAGHNKIAYLSQHFELWNNYYVHELLEYANELSESRSFELYKICQIDHLLNRYSDELSGGEKQRVALAALLTRSPELLLLDEPFSNLDAINKNIIKKVLTDVSKEFNLDLILISHDYGDVLPWATTIHILKSGKILQSGSASELYHFPEDEYCAALLGNYSLLKTENVDLSNHFKHKLNKRIFLRPEYLQIDEEGKSGFLGVLECVDFLGSYYLLHVKYNECMLKIIQKNIRKSISKNETVHFKISNGIL